MVEVAGKEEEEQVQALASWVEEELHAGVDHDIPGVDGLVLVEAAVPCRPSVGGELQPSHPC